MEGEGAGTADSGSGETEGAGTVPSDPKIDCLVCKHCKAVISLADHLIEQRIEFLNSDVFSYDLDIFDREYVFCQRLLIVRFASECAVQIYESDWVVHLVSVGVDCVVVLVCL